MFDQILLVSFATVTSTFVFRRCVRIKTDITGILVLTINMLIITTNVEMSG